MMSPGLATFGLPASPTAQALHDGRLFSWMSLAGWLFPSLILVPLIVGANRHGIERLLLRRIYRLDHMYGLLDIWHLTFIQGPFVWLFATAGRPYPVPRAARRLDLGFMFPPTYPRLGCRCVAGILSGCGWL